MEISIVDKSCPRKDWHFSMSDFNIPWFMEPTLSWNHQSFLKIVLEKLICFFKYISNQNVSDFLVSKTFADPKFVLESKCYQPTFSNLYIFGFKFLVGTKICLDMKFIWTRRAVGSKIFWSLRFLMRGIF